MTTELNFKDFEPKDLIGRKVLLLMGSVHEPSRSIRVIKKAHKNFFFLDGETKYRYNGDAIGREGIQYWSTINRCELLSEEREKELRAEFAENNRRFALKKEYQAKFAEFEKTATSQQWEQLIKAIETQ